MELGNPKTLDEEQTTLIKRHLAMVFIHEIDSTFGVEQQKTLNITHRPDGSPGSAVYRC